jgi:O-antigen/teichoic acid export membrane protein
MPIEPHDPEEFDSSLSAPQIIIENLQRPGLSRRGRIVQVVTSFLFGQGAIQAINAIAGFFLVHRLSIEAYAQFGLATGFQTVFGVLVDFGFASTIIPLVGNRREDRALVGRYVRAAKHLRDRGFWFLSPIAAVAFLAIIHRHHWSWSVQILLVCAVLLTLYSSGTISCFSAPLFIFGRLREYYVPQVVLGAGRLLLYLGLASVGALNASTAAGMVALNATANGAFVRRASLGLIKWPEKEDPETDKELLQYILPASPAIIFSAFQMQISLFLVSLFGGSLYIAEVSALGRIGVLFTALMTFNTIVVEPYVARRSIKGLRRTFAGIVLLAALICFPVVLVAFLHPGVFLWLLGAKYDGVRQALGWYVLSASMNFVAGAVWIMNRARKWVFWSGSILEVVLLLGVQIAFLGLIGVRNTNQAVMFNLASSCCYLIAHLYVTVYGFARASVKH